MFSGRVYSKTHGVAGTVRSSLSKAFSTSGSAPAYTTNFVPSMTVGGGCHKLLGPSMVSKGIKNPLIVTDKTMTALGYVKMIQTNLDSYGIASGSVFDDTVEDPTTDVITNGVKHLLAGKHDCIIALGGGSPIDTAKGMSLMAAKSPDSALREFKAPHNNTAIDSVPLVAIPTTAGTGSECTKFTVVTDTETGEKMLILGDSLLPTEAFIDYTFTMSIPFRSTADTGIDTLTHAIEAYVSKKANPVSDAFALKTVKLVYDNLRTVCNDLSDLKARENMMIAATMGGLAFSNASVALVHGMSRPLGAHFHIPHGLSNAMLLPAITEFSVPAATSKYADVARTMGVVPNSATDAEAADWLIRELVQLNDDLEVPSISAFRGVEADKFNELLPTMAEQAIGSGSPGNNPRIATPEEIVELYKKCF